MPERRKQNRSRPYALRASAVAFIFFSVVSGFIVTGTRPETVGLLGVVSFFGVLYAAFFSLIVLMYAFRQRVEGIQFRGILKSGVLALAPVMLLALSSTSPLGILDVLLVASFQVAALFYVSRVS